MAEKISELSGAEREQRIAELKRKMQESAKMAQAAHVADTAPAGAAKPAATATARPAPKAAAAVAVAQPVVKQTDVAPADGNGAAAPAPRVAPAPRPPAPRPAATEEPATPALTQADMSRREFLTYAWGAAMGLLLAEAGVASFLFLYPRFREGEFGGKFRLPISTLPDQTMAPVGYTDGKFWLVQTEEGQPKAIYMVCTHLGCLYKWAPSNNRFECPCHGSKFSHDGFYIEGPAPRSLDSFEIALEGEEIVVDTGAKITGLPSAESPARAQV